MEFLSYLISGISLGSVYAIIALGYTMVYGIAKMLNFAHGDVIMIGGYVSFCAMFYLGLPNIVAVLLAVIVCTVLGVVIERLAYKPLRSAPSLAVLITAIGVSYFLQNSALLIWKAAARVYPPVVEGSMQLFGGKLTVSYVSLLTIAACVVIIYLYVLIRYYVLPANCKILCSRKCPMKEDIVARNVQSVPRSVLQMLSIFLDWPKNQQYKLDMLYGLRKIVSY